MKHKAKSIVLYIYICTSVLLSFQSHGSEHVARFV